MTRGIFRERDAANSACRQIPRGRRGGICLYGIFRDSTKCCCYGLLRFTVEMRYATSRGVGLLNLVILPIGYQLPSLGRDSRADKFLRFVACNLGYPGWTVCDRNYETTLKRTRRFPWRNSPRHSFFNYHSRNDIIPRRRGRVIAPIPSKIIVFNNKTCM